MKLADLHLHTHFSDGTYSPEELATHAREQGLDAVALTDHDSVEGCERMGEACRKEGLEFIPGAELTAEVTGQEVHILGYWMDLESGRLRSELHRFQGVRQRRLRDMVTRLNESGVNLSESLVLSLANCEARVACTSLALSCSRGSLATTITRSTVSSSVAAPDSCPSPA